MKLLWISLALHAGAVHAASMQSYFLNRDGVKKLAEKSYYPAYQDFLHALEDDPMNPDLHMNMALSFHLNEEYAKAEQAYKGALKLLPADSTRRFEALFNLADTQVKQKKIDEALSTYQAALAMDPDSKEVKTNIELLWQGGEGEGDGEQENEDEKDGEQNKRSQGQNEQKQKQKQTPKKKQPKPFESKQLTPQDVKKILDEIKNQEQGIRAKEYDRGAKEAPRGKDW